MGRGAAVVVGMVAGALALGIARFALVEPPGGVHHHANFALFIDGNRVDLTGDRYMEDVAACSADPDAVLPRDRVHLHNHDMDVVHVHHGGATWAHLMANLGFGLGERYLIAPDGRRYFDGEEGRTLKFFLDGRQVSDLSNVTIGSEDRVLISMGAETPDEALAAQFPQVASTAGRMNEMSDPAGCAGAHRELSLGQRLRYAFWR